MTRIAWVNGKSLGKYELEAEAGENDKGEDTFEPSLWMMLKTPTILINTAIAVVQWSVISGGFYMIGFYVKYIEGNVFFISITSNIGVLIGYLSAGFL